MATMQYIPNVTTLELAPETCTGCRLCVDVCPQAVFVIEAKKAKIVDLDACMECGACAKNCPESIITVRPGVGCAYAIIMGAIRGTEPNCGCEDGTSACC